MTTKQFKTYWSKTYPDSFLIGYELKTIFSNRWFRIHNLPDSKRHPENEDDYEILLTRQNKLMSDLFLSDEFFLVVGMYKYDSSKLLTNDYFDLNKFQKVDTLALHNIRPQEYHDGEVFYEIYIRPEKWEPDIFNDLLIKIADDDVRVMFVNVKKNITVIPYDGGVDIILPDTQTRDKIKLKYKNWLSAREDGL